MAIKHYSVLLNEVIDKLNIKPDGIYVDATLGLGGHSYEIAKRLNTGKLIVFDQDERAMEEAKEKLKEFSNITYVLSNFENLEFELSKLGINQIDGILYDLGTSYYQLTEEDRGFTYHGEAKLDMRMDQSKELSAIDVINNYSEAELARVFRDYGDEKQSKKLATAIVEAREEKPITMNTELNEIIKSVKGYRDKHPSKNIYQAIRIEVNNELGVIKDSLEQAIKLLSTDGRVLVITFHSLEDKIVKQLFWENKNKIIETPMENIHLFHTIKTIYPSQEEIEENMASRSAKLRTIIKLHE